MGREGQAAATWLPSLLPSLRLTGSVTPGKLLTLSAPPFPRTVPTPSPTPPPPPRPGHVAAVLHAKCRPIGASERRPETAFQRHRLVTHRHPHGVEFWGPDLPRRLRTSRPRWCGVEGAAGVASPMPTVRSHALLTTALPPRGSWSGARGRFSRGCFRRELLLLGEGCPDTPAARRCSLGADRLCTLLAGK